MPNWSFTHMTISVNEVNADKLKELYRKITEEWTTKNYVESDFGNMWLGNIVGFSGIDNRDKGDFTVRCRGSLTGISLGINCMSVSTETAWSPMFDMWHKLMKKYVCDDYEITYDSTDDCNNYHITNDPELINHYDVDCYGESIEDKVGYNPSNISATEDAVIDMLQDVLDSNSTDIVELLKLFYESDYTEDMSINKWEQSDCTED